MDVWEAIEVCITSFGQIRADVYFSCLQSDYPFLVVGCPEQLYAVRCDTASAQQICLLIILRYLRPIALVEQSGNERIAVDLHHSSLHGAAVRAYHLQSTDPQTICAVSE